MPAADLSAAVQRSGIAPGPLAPSFGVQPSPDAAARLASLSGRSAEIVDAVVVALADPPRSAVVQFSVADESVSRLILAWSRTVERVAVVARQGSEAVLSLRTPDEVAMLFAGAVGLDGPLEPLDVRVNISSRQAVVWVALADTLRRARLHSILAHGAPSDTCTVNDVMATLAAADAEDFRWALNMLDKVAAERPSSIADAATVTGALDGLVAARVLDVTPADADGPALYGLADTGIAAFDAWAHEIGRLSVTVRGGAGGEIAAETVLLVRDARRLWLVDITSERGAIACLGRHGAEHVLRNLAGAAIPAAAG